jgi:hypothetical protein
MALSLVFAAAFALQGGSVTIRVGEKEKADSLAARRARIEASLEEVRDDTTRRRRPAIRIPLTAQHLATAYKDPASKALVERARVARLRQDSALVSYDARAYERISVGVGVKFLGRERLAFRHEDAARVRWSRKNGAHVEITGARTAVPIAAGVDDDGDAEVDGLAPIPYFPGRDHLWFGSGIARAEVDERNLVHPIAEGAEAYYTYETGDSVEMRLPDGDRIVLRELKILAREPKWNITVGSFWFDDRSAQLVRAAYRFSTSMDIWTVAKEENERERRERAADTSAAARARNANRNNDDDGPPAWVRGMMSPMKADITGITVEYGLYNQRFWLPRAQSVDGHMQASFVRVPITFEQRFRYESVNGADSVPPMPPTERSRVVALRDSLRKAGVDSLVRDSLVRVARRERAEQLAVQRKQDCATKGYTTRFQNQFDGALRTALQVPCDTLKLQNSPDLPGSIFDANEELWQTSDRLELMKSLSFSLQPGWGPQMPVIDYGLPLTRYNRVEGLSTAITATSALGKGYEASLLARGSFADRQLNGELAVWRSNGRRTIRGAVYRRLQASDDWGNPLSFGASLAGLLYARDEGAYYRAWGGEITSTPVAPGAIEWRLFGEQQWGDSVHSRWTLFGGGGDTRFIPNPMAIRTTHAGVGMRMRPQWGLNPDGFRTMMDIRAEVAGGDSTYGRGLADLTFTLPVSRLNLGLTLSAGSSAGALPPQRNFYLGGLQSVRGQTALTATGNTFWLARGEIGTRFTGARTVVFGDIGWAGDRDDISKPGRPLSGVGFGWSFLDGLIRTDISRGIFPSKQWRFDIHLDAKF